MAILGLDMLWWVMMYTEAVLMPSMMWVMNQGFRWPR